MKNEKWMNLKTDCSMDIYDLHPDNVVEWLDSGRSAELPAEAIIYLEQLEIVRSMYSHLKAKQLILNTYEIFTPDVPPTGSTM